MNKRVGRREDDEDGPKNGVETFAEELKAQREAAGLTQDDLGKSMGYSASLIAKLETLRGLPSPKFAELADKVFHLPGTFKRLRKGMINGAYAPWFQAYIDIENRATVLKSWQPLVVPGQLQTEAYARAILRSARPGDSDAEVERLVAARMARQAIWEREDPPPPILSAILSEIVLRIPVGGTDVMREQLERLIEDSSNPRISIQIMPLSAGAHPGLLGNFVVASFDHGPDAAYLDNALTGQVTERRSQVSRISLLYDTLRGEALSPGASIDFITRVVQEWT